MLRKFNKENNRKIIPKTQAIKVNYVEVRIHGRSSSTVSIRSITSKTAIPENPKSLPYHQNSISLY